MSTWDNDAKSGKHARAINQYCAELFIKLATDCYGYDEKPLPVGQYQCLHSWKTYNSGWSKYDYCEKCDVKRDTTNDAPTERQ